MIKIDKIHISDITPAEYNPRKISDKEFIKLKNSLNEFGLVEPILINLKNNTIIGGHQRYKALIDNYMVNNDFYHELNLIRFGDVGWVFDEEKLTIKNKDYEKLLNLALNKITGEWDEEKVEPILNELKLNGFDISLTGFELELEEVNEPVFNEGIDIDNNENENSFIFKDTEIINDVIKNYKRLDVNTFKTIFIDRASAMYQFNNLVNGKNQGFFIPYLFSNDEINYLLSLVNEKKFINGFAEWIVKNKDNVPNYYYYDKLIIEYLKNKNDYDILTPYEIRVLFEGVDLENKSILNVGDNGACVVGVCSLLFNGEYTEINPKYDFKDLIDFLKLNSNYNLDYKKNKYYDYVFLNFNYGNEDYLSLLKNLDFGIGFVYCNDKIKKRLLNNFNIEIIEISGKELLIIKRDENGN